MTKEKKLRERLAKLVKELDVSDDELANFMTGALIAWCVQRGLDPIEWVWGAVDREWATS